MIRLAAAVLVAIAVLAGCGDDGGSGGSAQDRARAARILGDYRDTGQAEQWSIESVKVDGGAVTIETGLEATTENEASFEEPCATLVGIYPWIESIAVEGKDGKAHVSWGTGDVGCEISGLS